jgi:hypothetical protein
MRKNTLLVTLLLVLTITFGTVYAVVQQVLRFSANDPQIQLAEDTAAALDGGATPAQLFSTKVSLNRSLAPFVIIYDKTGAVVAGNGELNGRVPKAPIGVLQAAANKPYNAVTWQPQGDLRIAAISVVADKYYVLSGRSLKEVESREQEAIYMSLGGGVAAAIVTVAGWYASMKRS